MRIVLLLALLATVSACGGHTQERRAVHVRGAATNLDITEGCFLLLRSNVVGGGWSTYCMKRFINDPGPNVTVLSTGELTFNLPDGTIRTHVRVRTKFGPDGHHAVQHVTGTVDGGGTITGGGSYDEDAPGHVARSNLRYVIVH